MKVLINRILRYQIQNKYISEKDEDLYIYAYTILIEESVNILIAFIIGLLSNEIKFILCFLGSYISLRRYAGGYHAKRSVTCMVVSAILIILVCILKKSQVIDFRSNAMYFVLILAQIVILVVSPVDSESKRLSRSECKKYRNKTFKVFLIQELLLIFSTKLKKRFMYYGIVYSHLVLVCMLLVGFIYNVYKKEI